jgi:hypothetical protein
MTEKEAQPGGVTAAHRPEHKIEVRIFTLADHAAAIEQDGKLYLNGAGVDRVRVREFPATLPPLWLAARIYVPWEMVGEELTLRVSAFDADRNPVGPDPLLQGSRPRPARQADRDTLAINLAFGLAGLPIQREGKIYFRVDVVGHTLGPLPLEIQRLPDPSAQPVSLA